MIDLPVYCVSKVNNLTGRNHFTAIALSWLSLCLTVPHVCHTLMCCCSPHKQMTIVPLNTVVVCDTKRLGRQQVQNTRKPCENAFQFHVDDRFAVR